MSLPVNAKHLHHEARDHAPQGDHSKRRIPHYGPQEVLATLKGTPPTPLPGTYGNLQDLQKKSSSEDRARKISDSALPALQHFVDQFSLYDVPGLRDRKQIIELTHMMRKALSASLDLTSYYCNLADFTNVDAEKKNFLLFLELIRTTNNFFNSMLQADTPPLLTVHDKLIESITDWNDSIKDPTSSSVLEKSRMILASLDSLLKTQENPAHIKKDPDHSVIRKDLIGFLSELAYIQRIAFYLFKEKHPSLFFDFFISKIENTIKSNEALTLFDLRSTVEFVLCLLALLAEVHNEHLDDMPLSDGDTQSYENLMQSFLRRTVATLDSSLKNQPHSTNEVNETLNSFSALIEEPLYNSAFLEALSFKIKEFLQSDPSDQTHFSIIHYAHELFSKSLTEPTPPLRVDSLGEQLDAVSLGSTDSDTDSDHEENTSLLPGRLALVLAFSPALFFCALNL